mmetsp:Transcript_11035/g.23220  ORF Transcript_11035/g.23220 Transcript_11035/m.23220 type:complete len:154 (-) Transcript_11035:219-680(-)
MKVKLVSPFYKISSYSNTSHTMGFQSPKSNQYIITTAAISPPPPPIHHCRRLLQPSDSDSCCDIPEFLPAEGSILNDYATTVDKKQNWTNIPFAHTLTDENVTLLLLSRDVPRMTKPLRRRPTCGEFTHDSKRAKSSCRCISIHCTESIPPLP